MKIIIPILILILSFQNCKNNFAKEDRNAIFTGLGMLLYSNNRVSISGSAAKGVIRYANVSVYPVSADGTCNKSNLLASEKTDGSGNYSVRYTKTGGLVCIITSASPDDTSVVYDEKTKSDLVLSPSSKFELVSILPESKIVSNSRKNQNASPFSKFAAKRFQSLVKEAGSTANSPALLVKANKEVVIRFGLSTGLSGKTGKEVKSIKNVSTINGDTFPELDDILVEIGKPADPINAKYISILGGFSWLANKYKKGSKVTTEDTDSIIDAFSSDFEDGVFDGKQKDGKSITIGTAPNQLTFPSDPLNSVLLLAIQSYFQEGGTLDTGAPNLTNSTMTITPANITSQVQLLGATPITISNNSSSPPTVSYVGSPFSLGQFGLATLTPTVSGTITNCTVTPTLPTGLTLSPTTCVITGTPTTSQGFITYSISLTSTTGTATTTISIRVLVDAIANSLSTSLASYNAALTNDLVKVTQAEYNLVQTNLSGTIGGYNGLIDNNWATAIAGTQTYAYQTTFVHANTVPLLPASSYVVAFTFISATNPPHSFSCQLKYSTGSFLGNIANLYNGATIATLDRQYFVIKKPSVQIPASPPSYLSLYNTNGIGTVSLVAHTHDYVAGNQVGAQAFLTFTAASTQYPTMQVLTTTTKNW